MCVVALALNAHPKWSIILAGNRDELHARPSAPLAQWEGTDSHIIAGRDLVSGGTWLGVSTTGRLAVVTNIRTGALPDPDKLSRGDLVADYLRGKETPPATQLGHYNPFSLLCVGPDEATLVANRPNAICRTIADGIHGLSNGAPDEEWPRKSLLLKAFNIALNTAADLPEAMLCLLSRESAQDSIFIRDAVYGTRSSSVVLVDQDGAGLIVEQQFGQNGTTKARTAIDFQLSRKTAQPY
jgi:uncharacterized protein with NRDE domain